MKEYCIAVALGWLALNGAVLLALIISALIKSAPMGHEENDGFHTDNSQ